jgi:hypothetical protein
LNNVLEQQRAMLGGPALLLAIKPNEKRPQVEGWTQIPASAMNDPKYLATLNHGGNLGVACGQVSAGLCSIDIDDDEKMEAFLALNPRLRSTLRTKRKRGGNFWVRIKGDFPKLHKIKDAEGQPWGEWRSDGGQTVIYGQAMDRDKGETKPTRYRVIVEAPPVEIAFDEILWPAGLVLPWAPTPEEKAIPVKSAPGAIILPGGTVGILDCANQVFPLLAKTKRVFNRSGVIVELTPKFALEIVRPAGFRSRLENCGQIMAWRKGRNENSVLQPTTCPEDMARALLESEPARDLLPQIAVVTGCPVAIEDEDGNLEVLARGYHPELGGLLVTAGVTPPHVEVEEAAAALADLHSEFDFQSPADHSRALAAFISPALSIGGFLRGRVPADVAEADQSQAGKGYRQKILAAIYNEAPQVVAQRDGGVGSLDESFSQALIAGRPFVQIDNLRGVLNSPFLEAFFTADSIGARVPHRGEVQIDPRRFFVLATSNGVESTRDFANRSCIVRIRKREGHQFRTYSEGGLLEHVKARQPYYLGCVFSVIAEWLASGKPRAQDTRHDFREWAQTLDWIVRHIFGAAPLLDGHVAAQERVSNPAMVFLRALCLAAEQEGRLPETFTASGFAELADTHNISIPGIRPGNEERAAKQIGIHLSRVFKAKENAEVDGFNVQRSERWETRLEGGAYQVKTYAIARI